MKKEFLNKFDFFSDHDLSYSYDSLTRVFNRETIYNYIQSLIDQKMPFSLIIGDVDNFKYVNDIYGHLIGDKVLMQCAGNFMETVEDTGVVGRYGGDEFIIVLPEVAEYDDLWTQCRALNYSSKDLMVEEFRGSSITFTLGAVRFPLNGTTIEELMTKADKALYRGKQKGRNCFIIYLPEKHDSLQIGEKGKALFRTIDLHQRVFSNLTHDDNFAVNIDNLMRFLSSTLMIDHICLQSNKKVCNSVIYPLSAVKSFTMIPGEVLYHSTKINGNCSINDREILEIMQDNELHMHMERQNITGALYVQIECFGTLFGYLRAESAVDGGRIWQAQDMDIMFVFAKTLGMLLYYNNIDLDQIF